MRIQHYSIHTESTYIEWIKRYMYYHNMQSREDLQYGNKGRSLNNSITHFNNW